MHVARAARPAGRVHRADRSVAVDGVRPPGVASARTGRPDDGVVTVEKTGDRVDVRGLDVEDLGLGTVGLDVGHVVGVADHRRDLVAALVEQRGEQAGDLAVGSDDGDAHVGATLAAGAGIPARQTGRVTDDATPHAGLSAMLGTTDPDILGNFVAFLGLAFTELAPDRVVATWTVEPLHQPFGILHGGAHCSVVETLASVGAALWVSGRDETAKVVGVNNNTDFFRAVARARMTSTATPLHRGRSQQLWLVETHADADGSAVGAPARCGCRTCTSAAEPTRDRLLAFPPLEWERLGMTTDGRTGPAPVPTGQLSKIDYSERIPNNVNLADDRRLQRALEGWQPKFLDWWKTLGLAGR